MTQRTSYGPEHLGDLEESIGVVAFVFLFFLSQLCKLLHERPSGWERMGGEKRGGERENERGRGKKNNRRYEEKEKRR